MKNFPSIIREQRVFKFLLLFRWAALFPALFALKQPMLFSSFFVLGFALLVNLVISIFNRPLNQLVTDHPLVLSTDVLFCGLLLAISGGIHSPYYLYALSPLLASAFFFQLGGATAASAVFTPLYLLASYFGVRQDAILLISQLAGIWLIPILFAYPSMFIKSINQANENLARAHRQLEIIHNLTILLQSAPDVLSVQERVLGVVTTDLGFSKAVVALVDPAREEFGAWMVYPADETFPRIKSLPLKSESGSLIKALLNRDSSPDPKMPLIQHADLDTWFHQNQWHFVPMYLREHPVGVLLVDESEITTERTSTLETVANQAALALGTTILCIDRARNFAVEAERNRIARDIHDTVAQSLFGITYSLDACINMLPEQAEQVQQELIELQALARSTHDEVRRSIFDLWPSALTIEIFMADLTNYVSNFCRPRSFSIIFNYHGDFNSLSPGLRRTIYRMAQEALANSARHSGTNAARLCLTVAEREIFVDVSDQGKGFEPSVALSRSQNREHFGLRGMQERARALGGECEILSRPTAGSRILIMLPIR